MLPNSIRQKKLPNNQPDLGGRNRLPPSTKKGVTKMKKFIYENKVEEFIRDTNGEEFLAVFVKRTTGEIRLMRASTEFSSLLKGGVAKYDAKDAGLIIVQDLDKQAIRSIPVDSLVAVSFGKMTFVVSNNKKEG